MGLGSYFNFGEILFLNWVEPLTSCMIMQMTEMLDASVSPSLQ